MKKLIMLSIFALGTITASASNDLFKNYYAEKTDQIQPVVMRYNYQVIVYKHIAPNLSTTPYKIQNYNCVTETEFSYHMFILDESLLSPPPGTVYTKTVTKLSRCLTWTPFP